MKLSILICSIPKRADMLKELVSQLKSQVYGNFKRSKQKIGKLTLIRYESKEVEILIGLDNKVLKVGEKRNILVEESRGKYISFIDDDDRISEEYIYYLLKGIETGVDVINFHVMFNPAKGTPKLVYYNLNYNDAETKECFYRATNHIMCIKRSKALIVKFKHISFGEDSDFAKRLKRVCSTQAEIPTVLYYYDFDHAKSETQ